MSKKHDFSVFQELGANKKSLTLKEVRYALIETFLRKNPNYRVSLQVLHEELKPWLRENVPSPSTIAKDLEEHLSRPGVIRGYRVHVSGRGQKQEVPSGTDSIANPAPQTRETMLEGLAVEILAERTLIEPAAKLQLGEALWHFLFGVAVTQSSDCAPPSYTSHLPARLAGKLSAIQEKSDPSITIDAGSTTAYAFETLLRVDSIPFMRGTVPPGPVTPTVMTNSPFIASLVRHSVHARSIPLRVIGGDVRADRASMCGRLSELALEAWELNTDISIIGTTGIRLRGGSFEFWCDDVDEASIKRRMLGLGSHLRVLVFHSGKLLKAGGAKAFASLSSKVVDLLVVDDGNDPDAPALKHLLAAAKTNQVGILLVHRPPASR